MKSTYKLLTFAGGKSTLLPHLTARIPRRVRSYYEPFIGGGALFLALTQDSSMSADRWVIGDKTPEITNLYRAVQLDGRSSSSGVIDAYRRMADAYAGLDYASKEAYFLAQRRAYNDRARIGDCRADYPTPDPEQAARLLFLNRSCFNGLYRVNARGDFNTSWGKTRFDRKGGVVDLSQSLDHWARILARPNVEIRTGPYQDTIAGIQADDLVYFDPPYVPAGPTANFTAYTADGFSAADQEQLAAESWRLRARGVHVLLSNSLGAQALYQSSDASARFDLQQVWARRNINCRLEGRRPVGEIIAYGGPLTASQV